MNDLFGETHCPHCNRAYEVQAPDFDDFWRECPVKLSKKQAATAWAKLSSHDRAQARDCVRSFYALFKRNYPGASPLLPSTYLNNRRWEDHGVTPSANVEMHKADVLRAMKSNIPAVRDHALRLATRLGIAGSE